MAGEFAELAFLGWPLLPPIEYQTEPSVLAHVTTIEFTPYFTFQLGLTLLAVIVWRQDGYPGLTVFRRETIQDYPRSPKYSQQGGERAFMPPDNDSSSLKFRFGLWLHRVFVRLRLLKHPWRNKHRHNTDSVDEWEDRWSVFRIGLKTMTILLVFDVAVIAAFAYFQLSMTAIIIGTGLLLIGNLPIQLWTLGRMRKARLEQWENE